MVGPVAQLTGAPMTLAAPPFTDSTYSNSSTSSTANASAFPSLTEQEMALLRPIARTQELADGETAFRAGDADIDFFVVESGLLDIINPANGNALVATHHPGHFTGDVDLLTRRPVIVTAVARGPTRLLRAPGAKLRQILNRVPSLGEKLLIAFTVRREL